MRFKWQQLISLIGILSMTGCAVLHEPKPDDPTYAPVIPSQLTPPSAVTGSIYQAYQQVSFFEDRTARRVGDVLTVKLVERTTASKDADTKIDKSSSVSVQTPVLPKYLDKLNDLNLAVSTGSDNAFDGGSEADQSNSLSGSITVTVIEVLPNGIMHVKGEKWMTLNRGDEFIRVSGLIRPDDVGPDNTVESTKLADARIAYSGTGDFANSNQMGWLTRFFNSPIWPF
jgi:flagellar L-ring protein precursor FlgH